MHYGTMYNHYNQKNITGGGALCACFAYSNLHIQWKLNVLDWPEMFPGLIGHQVPSPTVGNLMSDDLQHNHKHRGYSDKWFRTNPH